MMKAFVSVLFLCCVVGVARLHAQQKFQPGNADLTTVVRDTGAVKVIYRKAATQNSFASLPVEITLPARPAAPSYSIDFRNGATHEDVPVGVEYGESNGMEQPHGGEGKKVILTPGQDLYFRVKAGAAVFSSAVFHLIVPPAPAVEKILIDYESERLSNLPGGAVWRLGSGAESSVMVQLTSLIPAAGQSPLEAKIYVPATERSFASAVRTLQISPRPVVILRDMKKKVGMPAFVPDAFSSIDNSVKGITFASADGSVARVENNLVKPVGIGNSEITASMKANANGAHFAALPVKAVLSVSGENASGAVDLIRVTDLVICNGTEDCRLKFQNSDGTIGKLILFNAAGKVIYKAEHYNNDFEMGSLNSGTYYYLLHATVGGQSVVKKGFVEVVK